MVTGRGWSGRRASGPDLLPAHRPGPRYGAAGRRATLRPPGRQRNRPPWLPGGLRPPRETPRGHTPWAWRSRSRASCTRRGWRVSSGPQKGTRELRQSADSADGGIPPRALRPAADAGRRSPRPGRPRPAPQAGGRAVAEAEPRRSSSQPTRQHPPVIGTNPGRAPFWCKPPALRPLDDRSIFPKLTVGYSVSTACQGNCRHPQPPAGRGRRHSRAGSQSRQKPCAGIAEPVNRSGRRRVEPAGIVPRSELYPSTARSGLDSSDFLCYLGSAS